MKWFTVYWWAYSGKYDDYMDYSEKIQTNAPKKALSLIKQKYPRGKNFKICQNS